MPPAAQEGWEASLRPKGTMCAVADRRLLAFAYVKALGYLAIDHPVADRDRAARDHSRARAVFRAGNQDRLPNRSQNRTPARGATLAGRQAEPVTCNFSGRGGRI
jgi:hypothetical protein